jgi:hypothetical protein
MSTDRIPVLVTKAQKARIAKRAKAAGMTTGEFLRKAADAYSPANDEVLLDGLIGQVIETTARASRAIDEALAYVASSERRLGKRAPAARKVA